MPERLAFSVLEYVKILSLCRDSALECPGSALRKTMFYRYRLTIAANNPAVSIPTRRQMEAFDVLNRNRMAWCVLIGVLVLALGILGVIGYCLVTEKAVSVQLAMCVTEGVLFTCFRPIIVSLFPPKTAGASGSTIQSEE